jgi:hypothetical protein
VIQSMVLLLSFLYVYLPLLDGSQQFPFFNHIQKYYRYQ